MMSALIDPDSNHDRDLRIRFIDHLTFNIYSVVSFHHLALPGVRRLMAVTMDTMRLPLGNRTICRSFPKKTVSGYGFAAIAQAVRRRIRIADVTRG